MKKLIIFGTGKMAEMALYYFKNDSDYEPIGFTVDKKYAEEKKFMKLPMIPFENLIDRFPQDKYDIFVAIGYTKLNKLRREKYEEVKNLGYNCATYVSSRISSFDKVKAGENCFILENQVIQPNVRFGNNVIAWSGNHFGHDVSVDDHSWIASHTVISGNVKIGKSCFIGINSTIRDGIEIGDECLIGAGAIILKNTKEKEVYIEKQTPKYALDSERFMQMSDISK